MSVLADFECPDHGVFEARLPSDYDFAGCPECGESARWVPSPVSGRVKISEWLRGKSDPRPPETYCMNTEPLADGMPYTEWRAKQETINRDIALKKARAKL